MIGIIPRRIWRARKPKQVIHSDWKGKRMWVIAHHTAAAFTSRKRKDERAQLRRDQAFHMGPNRGWNDIGYNYLIFPSGRVYQGRGWGVVGSHAPGWNTRGIGIAFVGDFSHYVPTPEAVDAYHRLVYKLRKKGANIIAEQAHGDVFATSCPGSGVRRALGL